MLESSERSGVRVPPRFTMELYSAAIAASFAFCVIFGRRFARFVYLTSKIPGPSLWELVTVHAKHLLGDGMVIRVWELCAAYNYKPFGLWLTDGNYCIFVSDCETFEAVYKNKHLTEKCDIFYKQFSNFLGQSLTFMPGGREYLQYRKVVYSTGLRRSMQELFLPRMFEPLSEFVREVRKSAAGGKEVDVRSLVASYIMFATSLAFISAPHGDLSEYIQLYVNLFLPLYELTTVEAINPFYYNFYVRHKLSTKRTVAATKSLWAQIDEFVTNEKSHLKEELDENGAYSVLRAAIQSHQKLADPDDQKFFTHARLLFVASADTTSFTGNVLLLILALHQDVQQRVFDEISSVLGEEERPILVEDLDQLTYTEKVIKETMRLFPAVPIMGRKTREETNLNGILAPKGSAVIMNLMALHRNPEYFPDPLKFDPERLSPEASKELRPYSYLPFSTGMRSCPGKLHAFLMMKLLLCYTVRNFKILPGDKLKNLSDIKIKMCFTMQIKESSLRFVDRMSDKA